MKNILIYLIFTMTYLLIASRRLSLLPIGRPAGALLGATLMVATGILSPHESYLAVDHDTILLLFAMMTLSVYYERSGLFALLATRMVSLCPTPLRLLIVLVFFTGFLSAFLVNDTVCLFLTPVVVYICRQNQLPFGPYLIGLATSANIGSAATLVGNPQNMIIGSLSRFNFTNFIYYAGPAALAGLILNALLLWLYYGSILPKSRISVPQRPVVSNEGRPLVLLVITIGVITGFFMGFHMGYTALAGVVAMIVLDRQDPRRIFADVDWSLLIFFASLFIVVAGFAKTGIMEKMWEMASPLLSFSSLHGIGFFTTLMALGSNLISNVPMVLLTGPHLHILGDVKIGWVLLAFSTTIAGNLTLIGSVANIIVAESARDDYHLGFFEYLKFGLVSTLLVLSVGTAVVFFTMHW